MSTFDFIRRTKNKKGIYFVFSREEGWIFINRKEVFYYCNIYSKTAIEEDLEEIQNNLIRMINESNWIEDKRLKGDFTHRVELRKRPELTIRIKPLEIYKTKEKETPKNTNSEAIKPTLKDGEPRTEQPNEQPKNNIQETDQHPTE